MCCLEAVLPELGYYQTWPGIAVSRVAQVLDATRVNDEDGHGLDVKCDPGGGNNITAPHFADAGDDSPPLPGDFAALADSSGSGAEHVTGYADTKNAGRAAKGEKRIYARNPSGAVVAEVWLKGDGTVHVITAAAVLIGAEGQAVEAIPKGTTQKTKLDQILEYVKAIAAVINGTAILEPGNDAASALQSALKLATSDTPLPADLADTISTKHKIDA